MFSRYNLEFEWLVVTAWFVGYDDVQIFIAPDDCKSRSLEEHRRLLSHEIKRYKVVVEHWEEIPEYSSTCKISPGGMVINNGMDSSQNSFSTLGLYLETKDGKYALLTGHNRSEGDEIYSIQTVNGAVFDQPIGKINLKIAEGDPSTPFCDVAVVDIINNDIALSNHVTSCGNYCLHLNPEAEDLDPTQVQDVQLFVNGDVRRQRAQILKGYFEVPRLQQLNGCAVIDSRIGHPIHGKGERGILITTSVDNDKPHLVNGLAILTGILYNSWYQWSIGQPLKRTIDRIRSVERFKDLRIAGCRNYCATPKQ